MYEVIFTRRARKAMSRFPRREYERVLQAIEGLAEDPKSTGARKMRGTGNLGDWRIRVGRDYRVIYRVDDDAREVLILEAATGRGFTDAIDTAGLRPHGALPRHLRWQRETRTNGARNRLDVRPR